MGSKPKSTSLTAALSAATLLLLETGCSGSESDPGPQLTPNTRAPELVGVWLGSCLPNATGISSPTVSVTGSSGGGGGSPGSSKRTEITFNQNGSTSGIVEYFATGDCNTNFRTGSYRFDISYIVGNNVLAGDGSDAKELDMNDDGVITYSLFQVVNSNSLFVGELKQFEPERDGSTAAKRFNHFGTEYIKR